MEIDVVVMLRINKVSMKEAGKKSFLYGIW